MDERDRRPADGPARRGASVLRRRAARATAALAAAVVAVGLAVLAGWRWNVAGLMTVIPGAISMKANTAIAFVALALAVLVLHRTPPSAPRRALGAALAVLAMAIGALTLAEYLLGVNLGIDELLFRDPAATGAVPPGRLAPITAVNVVLLGIALLLSHVSRAPRFGVAHVLVLLAFLAGFQGLVGYVLGTTHTYGIAAWSQMAVHTTALFVLTCTAIFLSRPEGGLMAIATSPSAGGRLARALVASAILVPPLVGWLALQGERHGFWDPDFTTLLRVVGNSVFFAGLVWRNAAALHRLDLARDAAEAERARSFEALRSALRARDEFLTVASHELKTPLTALRLQVARFRSLAEAAPESPQVRALHDAVVTAERQVTRLAALASEIVDVAALSAGSVEVAPEALELAPFLADCVAAAAAALSAARCPVEIRVPPGVRARGDRRLLADVLRRILHNAATHAPGALVVLAARVDGDAVVVEVTDAGPGIALGDQARIFERFERAVADADKNPGFGVGLYVARQILRAHGGELSVRSAPPARGATFSFRLPAAAGARAAVPATGSAPAARDAQSVR
jgi:signal transduction histidine kinase